MALIHVIIARFLNSLKLCVANNTPRLDVMYLSHIFVVVKTLNSIPATTTIYTLKGMNYQEYHGVRFDALSVMPTVFVTLVLT